MERLRLLDTGCGVAVIGCWLGDERSEKRREKRILSRR